MAVKEELETLKSTIIEYRDQLYARYDELFKKFASKSRAVLMEFRNFVGTPRIRVGNVLGKKYLLPNIIPDTMTEPKISWIGPKRYYKIVPEAGQRGSTVREYDLVAMPVFEFDPISDVQAIQEWAKKQSVYVFTNSIYVRADRDVEQLTTFEDILYKYFFCDEVIDYGRTEYDMALWDDLPVWTAYYDGTIYCAHRVPAGARYVHIYNSLYPQIYMWIFMGEIEFYCPDTGRYWTEDAVFIELSDLAPMFGNKATWMFGNREIRAWFIMLRKGGLNWDIFVLMRRSEAEMLASRMLYPGEWAGLHLATLATGIARRFAVEYLTKTRSLG